jgi:aminoglycoside phosphotransferase family enzyme/predicted kinase
MSALIAALLRPDAYPHPVTEVRLIETHISWVLLAGEYAYKLKKPVDFGFLDFSSLDKRRFYCEEEVRLNRRLAPDIYLDVVPVTGNESAPSLQGRGPVLEWAVRMRAFPADATLDREAEITPAQIDAIADRIARFHKTIGVAEETDPYGTPEAVMHPVRENFSQLRPLIPDAEGVSREVVEKMGLLARWSEAEGARLTRFFSGRKAAGFIRDCHGDLHLGNIAWVDDAPLIFDCIEFNPDLRHVDVISEVAFLFMDLTERGHAGLAWRFLDRWLEHTGDYAGLDGLRFYLVYRAMVRAKVAGLRHAQDARADFTEVLRYLDLAQRLCRQLPVSLTLMHGCSGSGKTWASQRLLETLGAVRLRSDVERKRLYGLDALDASTTVPGGIYGPDANQRTLDRLLELAETLLACGFSAIVDATFLAHDWRQPFFELARRGEWPIHIVAMDVDAERMRSRILARERRADDASEAGLAVLEAQQKSLEPLDGVEMEHAHRFDPDQPGAWEALLAVYPGTTLLSR